jgi:DNA-binding beta-propeller fold protein YncE
LLIDGCRIFVGNWQTGNISIVDPEKRTIESVIELDNYEASPSSKQRGEIRRYQPGNMVIADGRLFLGQVFSDFVLAIDVATQSVVKRLVLPGGGEGQVASSNDGRSVYFASNKEDCFFIIDSATYEYEQVPYPQGGRGCMSILAHPHKPLLYVGIQRGGTLNGKSYPGGNCFLAVYDLAARKYIKNIYLAEVKGNRSDDSTPACLLYDLDHHIYVGMFQSLKGIYKIDEETLEVVGNIYFAPNEHNKFFTWVDPLSLALYKNSIISVNRNNRELVLIDKITGQTSKSMYLGEAPNGPRDVVVYRNEAIISYPKRHGLIFINLGDG